MSSNEIFNCKNDYVFLDFIEKRTYTELLEDYNYLKEKFDVVNTKYVLKKYFKILLEKELVDLIYHKDMFFFIDGVWHFTDCPKIMKEEIGLLQQQQQQQSTFSSHLFDVCYCSDEMEFPDSKFEKYIKSTAAIFGETASSFIIGDGSGKEDITLSFTEVHLEKYKDSSSNYYPSDISNEAYTFRYFGNYYKFPSYYSSELKLKGLGQLEYIRDNIASRLRYVNFLKIVEASDMKKLTGLKIVDGYWHIKECNFTDEKRYSRSLLPPNCDCNAAFDHPKGYLHKKYGKFDGSDTGYGLIKRQLFKLPI